MKYKTKATTGARRDRTRWIQGLVAGFLILLPFIASWQGFDNFRLPKNVFASLSILTIVVATVFLTKPRVRFPLVSWEALLCGGVAYAGLHTLISAAPGWSWASFIPIFLFTLLFFCIRSVATLRFQRVVWLLISGALAIDAVLSIFQFYGMIAGMTDLTGQVISGRINPAGFIGDVNTGGFLFGLVSLILVYFLVVEKDLRIKVLAGFLMALNLAGLAYTRTLTAVVAVMVCGLAWLAFHHWWVIRRAGRFPRSLVYLWVVLIVLGSGAVAIAAQSGLIGRVQTVVRLVERGNWSVATAGRQPVYWLTWQMILEKPWLGHGLSTFGREFFYYRADTEEGQSVNLLQQPGAFREVHNDFLQVWEELGLPGIAVLVALFAIPLVRSVRLLPREADPAKQYWYGMLSIVVVFVAVSCLAFFPLRLGLTASYIVLVFAGLRHYQLDGKSFEPDVDRSAARLLLGVRVILVLLAVLVGIREVRLWSANNDLGMANFLLVQASSGQFPARQSRMFADQALVRLDHAKEVAPSIAETDNLKGSAFMRLGRYGQAAESYRRAVEQIPSPEVATNLAAAYLAQKEWSEAERYLLLALRYDSGYPKARDALRFLKDQQRR